MVAINANARNMLRHGAVEVQRSTIGSTVRYQDPYTIRSALETRYVGL